MLNDFEVREMTSIIVNNLEIEKALNKHQGSIFFLPRAKLSLTFSNFWLPNICLSVAQIQKKNLKHISMNKKENLG